jgi:predicted MFS family arabinose efflux permease
VAALWLAHGGAAAATASRVLWAFLAFGLSVAALALSDHLLVAIAVMVAFGVAGELRRTGTISILQTAVDDQQRGRVMSTQFMFQRVAGGLGALLVGSTAEQTGLRAPLLVAAGFSIAAWGIAFLHRKRIAAAFAG